MEIKKPWQYASYMLWWSKTFSSLLKRLLFVFCIMRILQRKLLIISIERKSVSKVSKKVFFWIWTTFVTRIVSAQNSKSVGTLGLNFWSSVPTFYR